MTEKKKPARRGRLQTQFIIFSLVICSTFSALSYDAKAVIFIDITNYYYAHTNAPGTHQFRTQTGASRIRGDADTNNAVYLRIRVQESGMQPGDSIIVTMYPSQVEREVTPNVTYDISEFAAREISLRLEKTGTNEVYARLRTMTVDDADATEDIQYTFQGNTPTQYGDLPVPQIIDSDSYYVEYRDEYRLDYDPPSGSGISSYELYFRSHTGEVFTRTYTQPPNGIHFLTCSPGMYRMHFYDSSGHMTHMTGEHPTSQIQNPTCESYTEGGAKNDLSASYDGENLNWQPIPGADRYEIYENGQKIGETSDTSYPISPPASVSIIARDGNGNIIGESDMNVSTGSGTCDMCEKIRNALECPEWNTYMGELTDAIRDALPPPPNWHEIADIFVSAFADYFGDVPDVPTREEIAGNITPQLPELDTDIPYSDMEPLVPDEYENPLEFDITTGEVIPIVDDSEAFDIYEYDHFIDHDEPGQMVFPGDPRNHSSGIKDPDRIESEYPEPIPTLPPDSGEIPPDDMPSPDIPESDMPSPGIPESDIPTPDIPESIIPIPTIP